MKITFIFCTSCDDALSFPLGVGLLSAILKGKGHQVDGIYVQVPVDESIDLHTISRKVAAFAPDLICFSATSPVFTYIRRIASSLRRQNKIPTLCGGMHATLYPDDALAAEGIDYVCIGEGERPLSLFVDSFQKGPEALLLIPGIWGKAQDGKLVCNKVLPLEQNLDCLPYVDYDAFGSDMTSSFMQDGWQRFIMSRGCPYKCSYCHNDIIRKTYSNVIGCPENTLGYVRFRSPDSAIDEIIDIGEKYGVKVINFMDDLFCLDKRRTLDFCQKFATRVPKDISYSIQTHLNHLDKEVVDALVKSRCIRVVVGVESANTRILGLLNRKMNPETMGQTLRLLLDAKFPRGVWTLNILGSPTETYDEMMETLAINARNLVTVCKFNFMAPYPGTSIYEFCKKNNLFKDYQEQRVEDRYFTVLKHARREAFFLDKFFDIGHWYLNLLSPLGLEKYYAHLIDEVEQIPTESWHRLKDKYSEIDKQIEDELKSTRTCHYRFLFKGKIIGKVIGLSSYESGVS